MRGKKKRSMNNHVYITMSNKIKHSEMFLVSKINQHNEYIHILGF